MTNRPISEIAAEAERGLRWLTEPKAGDVVTPVKYQGGAAVVTEVIHDNDADPDDYFIRLRPADDPDGPERPLSREKWERMLSAGIVDWMSR